MCQESHRVLLGEVFCDEDYIFGRIIGWKKKNEPQIRDKIIIYTKIEAEQSDLEAIKWALIKVIESG